MAAAFQRLEQEDWAAASPLLDRAARQLPSFAENLHVEQARVLRLLGRWEPNEHEDWLDSSPQLAALTALETGKDVKGPSLAYSLLASGDLDGAVDEARSEPRVYSRVVRLAAASDKATPELIERSFGIADDAGLDSDTVWPTLALAVRTHRPHEAFVKQARQLAGETADQLLQALEVKPANASEVAKRAVAGLRPEQRAEGLVMVTVLLGDATPPAVREQAKRTLFAPERPYFR